MATYISRKQILTMSYLDVFFSSYDTRSQLLFDTPSPPVCVSKSILLCVYASWSKSHVLQTIFLWKSGNRRKNVAHNENRIYAKMYNKIFQIFIFIFKTLRTIHFFSYRHFFFLFTIHFIYIYVYMCVYTLIKYENWKYEILIGSPMKNNFFNLVT